MLTSTIVGVVGFNSFACQSDNVSSECLTVEAISKNCIIDSATKNYYNVNNKGCALFKQYYKDLAQASIKYSTSTLKINPYLIAGIIQRETKWGQYGYGEGCDIKGDWGNGWGIAQMDVRYNNGIASGKATKPTIKYGNEQFSWNSCSDNIFYVGAYLMSIEDGFKSQYITKLSSAGLNTKLNENGFEDIKTSNAYMRLVINSYNAGGTGVLNRCNVSKEGTVSDNCTTGGDYSADILRIGEEFYDCLNNKRPESSDELLSTVITEKSKELDDCINKISSSVNKASTINSNSIITPEVKKYVASTIKNIPSPIESELRFEGQSTSLIKDFQKSINAPFASWKVSGPAKKWSNFIAGDKTGFEETQSLKTIAISDYNQLETGDIVLTKATNGNPFGHTGLFISKNENEFKLFDQLTNSDKNGPEIRSYKQTKFLGAIRYIKK